MSEYPIRCGNIRISINYLVVVIILLILGLMTGCEEKNTYVEPPPPKVTVAEPLQQEVIEYLEFTGNTRAFEEVELRARVAGFLKSMHFTPGTRVDMGDLLFVIDPREYEAELNAATAELNAARAMEHRAKIEYDRAQRVFKKGAGRETDVVKWRGERDVALAQIERATAKLERAKLNLSYTQVGAPISGRVSRNYVDVGNLVGEGEATLLTTISRYDPMYAYFNLNENDLLRVMSMYRKRVEEVGYNPDVDSDVRADIPLYLGLANEEGFPHEGIVDFAESGLDPETGTLQLRGVFTNPGPSPVLVPGLFARVRMPIDKQENALLVAERAVGADQSGRYVMVVNSENVVEKRSIRMGQLVDGLRVVEEGLAPGEPVVVNGIQRARSGAKVDPMRTEMRSLSVSALKAALEEKAAKQTPAETAGDAETRPVDTDGQADQNAGNEANEAGNDTPVDSKN